jgi:hypothetical protein
VKKQLIDPEVDGRIILKCILREIWCEKIVWTELVGEHSNENFGWITGNLEFSL